MNPASFRIALFSSLLSLSLTAIAHHSVSGQFDPEKTIVAEAVLKKVEWINPHPYFYYMIKQADGTDQPLAMETAAAAALMRAGLTSKEVLRVGDTHTVYYHPSRSGRPVGLLIAFSVGNDSRLIGANATESIEVAKRLAAERAAKGSQ